MATERAFYRDISFRVKISLRMMMSGSVFLSSWPIQTKKQEVGRRMFINLILGTLQYQTAARSRQRLERP